MARTIAALLLLFATLALLAACDDESDFLLDEGGPDATGTPPFEQRTPEASPDVTPEGSPLPAEATPVAAFEIETAETVNLRTEPSTEGGQDTVAGTLVPGDSATVTAQITGEEVDAGNDVWYQLDDGTFVYSGAVTEVEEEPETTEDATPTEEAEPEEDAEVEEGDA